MISENKIYIERMYEASVETVWNAWVDPTQAAQWWGPRGFTITTKHKDVNAGGSWSYVMHGPDGVDYPNHTKFIEVNKYSRMVYDHGGNDSQPPMFRVDVRFTNVNGKTKMEMSMIFPTAEIATASKKYIKQAGGNSTWDRLAEFLEQQATNKDIFIINQTFNASISTLFEIWTDPKHVAQWLAPTGSRMEYIKAEIKAGGTSFYVMANDDYKMYGKINYKEIIKPNKIVYTQFFCDENENITRHPMAPTWPEAMLTTIYFTAENDHQTRVSICWEIDGTATTIERETFHNAKAGMSQGWSGSFDKLENYLEKI